MDEKPGKPTRNPLLALARSLRNPQAAESLRSADESIPLGDHSRDVEAHARTIVEKLALPASLAQCVILAAHFHDFRQTAALLAARHRQHQCRSLFWRKPDRTPQAAPSVGAVSTRIRLVARRGESEGDFQRLPRDEQDLVLHLIAAHHGRARPHFPDDECVLTPSRILTRAARSTHRRRSPAPLRSTPAQVWPLGARLPRITAPRRRLRRQRGHQTTFGANAMSESTHTIRIRVDVTKPRPILRLLRAAGVGCSFLGTGDGKVLSLWLRDTFSPDDSPRRCG